MHKIETNTAGLSALSVLTLQSPGTGAFIGLSTDKASKNVAADGAQPIWADDPLRMKQFIVAMFDGDPVKLSGLVQENDAVECSAAHKVVVEVSVSAKNLPAFAAGRMSRTLVGLEISRVLEVWISPTKCVYDAQKVAKPAKEMDMNTGRVTAVAS